MDLNGPGVSIFQGNELSDFDNLAQDEEEEEALEEQIRRDLELKSILENAFDDVSFENDEESLCNGSPSNSTTNHLSLNNSNNDFDVNKFKKNMCNGVLNDSGNNCTNNVLATFNTPSKNSRNSLVKIVDMNGDSENYGNQCRKKLQNGNLHDLIDASGGGKVPQSANFNHLQRNALGDLPNGHNENDDSEKAQIVEDAYDSSEQLKILYDVRVREVHRLTEMIDSLRNEHEIAINKLKHQLAVSQAEIERGNISQSQLQTLLITNKQELDKMNQKIMELEKENLSLESCKSELLSQIETNKIVINDLERKVIVLEKNNKYSSDAVQYENNLKAIIEKHNFELTNMNGELEKVCKQNEELIKENSELKLKLNKLSQVNDETIANKCEIINRLSKQIDETQKQCESLMKSAAAEDILRLQMELKLMKEEKLSLAAKLETLEKENSRQEEELKQYESLSKISSFASIGESKDFNGTDVNGKLSEELYRALNGQRAKRQEIKNLQAQIDEKNRKIEMLTDNEKIFKCEITKLQETASKYVEEIKNNKKLISIKETENEKLHGLIENLRKETEATETEISRLKEEIESLRNNSSSSNGDKMGEGTPANYAEEYMRFHNEGLERVREETEKFFKLELLRKDLENENLKKEMDEIKNLYVEVFSSKEALIKQLEKEKNSSGRSSVVDVDEVKRLQKELDKSRQRILELDQTLKQQYEQEVQVLNANINRLTLQLEKVRKEKDREEAEKDKMFIENELLKTEIEQVTSEKNLLFLNFEKLKSDFEEIQINRQTLHQNNKTELKDVKERYEADLKNLTEKYEIIVKKLKKEIELTLTKSAKCETKFTSPMKIANKSVECQCSPPERKSASPRGKTCTKDVCTSPMSKSGSGNGVRSATASTESESNKLSRKEVVEIMEKLGAHHENEMKSLENKYRMELSKLEKKFQMEMLKAKDVIREELEKEHTAELERIHEKHKIELENRIEEEKKEAVADLITEWACEVQSLKASNAEAQTEMERMKMKYKAAKSVALQYKTYFKSKTEHMKEEWKRIEDGYEQALKELEKNVHLLVDVKEDEVKSKVDSITKIYEQKISKMKEKLSKCEDRLKAKEKKSSGESVLSRNVERLQLPNVNLCLSPSSFKSGTKAKGKERQKENDDDDESDLKAKRKELKELFERRKKSS